MTRNLTSMWYSVRRIEIIKFKHFQIFKKKALFGLYYLRFSKNKKKVFLLSYKYLERNAVLLDTFRSLDRKKGHGTEVMKYFLENMKQEGKNRVVLTFQPHKHKDRGEFALFLTKFGFKRVPGTFDTLQLAGLQKIDVHKLPAEPDEQEAREIVGKFVAQTR